MQSMFVHLCATQLCHIFCCNDMELEYFAKTNRTFLKFPLLYTFHFIYFSVYIYMSSVPLQKRKGKDEWNEMNSISIQNNGYKMQWQT